MSCDWLTKMLYNTLMHLCVCVQAWALLPQPPVRGFLLTWLKLTAAFLHNVKPMYLCRQMCSHPSQLSYLSCAYECLYVCYLCLAVNDYSYIKSDHDSWCLRLNLQYTELLFGFLFPLSFSFTFFDESKHVASLFFIVKKHFFLFALVEE